MRRPIIFILGFLLVAGLIYIGADAVRDRSSSAVTVDDPETTDAAQEKETPADDRAGAEPAAGSPHDEKREGDDPAAQPEKAGREEEKPADVKQEESGAPSGGADGEEAVAVIAEPDSITVLVNKSNRLPLDYKPDDLVYPDVPFIFEEKVEKRMMRKVAAEALERMFTAAKEDGIHLAGVSGYRSGNTQKALFERYVRRDGEEAASRYSARPGHSEHQTGLAMDVSGSTGKCAATDCFADTEEAAWLAENAHKYGFIIRYPKGKEEITGYKYEPWHLRYVGEEIAEAIWSQGITLEEYFDGAVAASASAAEAPSIP